MILAVEDVLSEVVGKSILAHVSVECSKTVGRTGNVYLRNKVAGLNQTAKGFPVLLLTDLDDLTMCAPRLIREWLPGHIEPNLIFRVVVVEIETWIMADRVGFARFLHVSPALVPTEPEKERNPKQKLLSLASRSTRRDIREDLLPASGATSRVGPGYNTRLTQFVRTEWDPERARGMAPSLARALSALERFAQQVEGLARR